MDTLHSKREAEGYLFLSEEDAELARAEKRNIDYLEKHMNYNSPDTVLRVYKKALVERVFKTPVGYEYLKRMQIYLKKCGTVDEEDIPPIVLQNGYQPRMRKSYSPARKRVKPADEKKAQWPVISVLLNIVLVIAVVAMFSITMKSDNPNILNYETALVNKYASWEQELTQRERAVRAKEAELNITID